jgi:hypothetical protein
MPIKQLAISVNSYLLRMSKMSVERMQTSNMRAVGTLLFSFVLLLTEQKNNHDFSTDL